MRTWKLKLWGCYLLIALNCVLLGWMVHDSQDCVATIQRDAHPVRQTARLFSTPSATLDQYKDQGRLTP
jgi:hypothetical protein